MRNGLVLGVVLALWCGVASAGFEVQYGTGRYTGGYVQPGYGSTYGGVPVRGYTRQNGTYVAPYYRTPADYTPRNNFSYPGNTNPYHYGGNYGSHHHR